MQGWLQGHRQQKLKLRFSNMYALYAKTLVIVVLCLPLQDVIARDWSDVTGKHKFVGDLIAANNETAVIRTKRGNLEAYIVNQLSEADQAFVKEYVASQPLETDPEKMHTWTGRDGLKFRGRVLGYGSKVVNIDFESGGIKVNKKRITELDEIYRKMVPRVVAEFDDETVKTEQDLRRWGQKLKGKPKSFTIDGVMMQLSDGEEIAVPLFMFSDEERAVLEEGWATWHAEATVEEDRNRESFLAQASAAEYQRNQQAEAKTDRQIQLMQLGMMAVNSGITNLWQVQMMPRPGVQARSMVVVIPAGNSAQASSLAVQKYPGFVPGAIRQMHRY